MSDLTDLDNYVAELERRLEHLNNKIERLEDTTDKHERRLNDLEIGR